MIFRDFLEDSGTLSATDPDDPELNGLVRTQTMKINKPSVNDKKKKKDKWDKLFMGEATGNPTAGIFFTTGNKVLLLKRTVVCGNPFTYGLPGGHAQEGETPLETAHREAVEEIGKVVGKRFGEKKEGNWTCFFYKVAEPFPCELNEEHSEYAWIPFHKLKKYKLHPKFKKVALKYIDFVESNYNKMPQSNHQRSS